MVWGTGMATTMQNYTSNMFFTVQRYRAIRPYDFASLLGVVSITMIRSRNTDLMRL